MFRDGLFRDRRAISSSLKRWLKSPEGDLYTHITIIRLSVVTVCTAHISKIFFFVLFRKIKVIKRYLIRIYIQMPLFWKVLLEKLDPNA